MVATPYPLPRSLRRSEVIAENGGKNYGPFGDNWGVFDLADVAVWRKLNGEARFTQMTAFTASKANPAQPYGPFSIVFDAALQAGASFYVEGKRRHERSLAVTRGGNIDGRQLEHELSKQAVVLQEVARDIGDARDLALDIESAQELAAEGVDARLGALELGANPLFSQYADYLDGLEIVNPREGRFGALGGNADDTAAVQAALNYLAANTGGALYLSDLHRTTAQLLWTSDKPLKVFSMQPYQGGLAVDHTGIGFHCSMGTYNTAAPPMFEQIQVTRAAGGSAGGTAIRVAYAVKGPGADKSCMINDCRIGRNGAAYFEYGIDLFRAPHSQLKHNFISGRSGLSTEKIGACVRLGDFCNGTVLLGNKGRGFLYGVLGIDSDDVSPDEFQAEGYEIIGNKFQACDHGVYCDLLSVEIGWSILGNTMDTALTRIFLRNLATVNISDNNFNHGDKTRAGADIVIVSDDGGAPPILMDASAKVLITGNRSVRKSDVSYLITAVAQGATTVMTYSEDGSVGVLANGDQVFFFADSNGLKELVERPGIVANLNLGAKTFEWKDYYTGLPVNSSAYGVFSGPALLTRYLRFLEVKGGADIFAANNQITNRNIGLHLWPQAKRVQFKDNVVLGGGVPNPNSEVLNDSLEKHSGRIIVSPASGPYDLGFAPEKFGAVAEKSDIVTAAANRLAFEAALGSGLLCDGGGRTYCISGKISLPTGTKLQNCTIKQLAPAASQSVITLEADGVDFVSLIKVRVDRNGSGLNAGSNAAPNAALNTAFGLKIIGGTGHHFEDVECYGDDSGTLLYFYGLDHTSKVIRPYAHDCIAVGAGITDDCVGGIAFLLCKGLVIDNPRVERLGWKSLIGGADPVADAEGAWLYSRGISTSGAEDCDIRNPRVRDTWQGINLTGDLGNGNIDVRITGHDVRNCATYGVKFANITHRCSASNGKVYLCGIAGYLDSASYSTLKTRADANKLTDCVAINCGNDVGTDVGFFKAAAELTYAVPLIIARCVAEDTRGTAKMNNGFYSELVPTVNAWVECLDCEVYGATEEPFRGVSAQWTIWHYLRRRTNGTMTNTTADQELFTIGANNYALEKDFNYDIEAEGFLSNMAASGDFKFGFGGTATFTGRYQSVAAKVAANDLHTPEGKQTSNMATTALVTAGAAIDGYFRIKGTLVCTVSGSLTVLAALGTAAAANVGTNSIFRIKKSMSNSSYQEDSAIVGPWA